jgi:hypothetical protein
MPALSSEPWLTLDVEVGPPLLFGNGEGCERRCVPILAFTVRGRLNGTGLPGGTDWQRIFPDGTTELAAHYAFETDQGELVEVTSNGLRAGPEAAMRALLAGEPVDPALIYFRSAMRFKTAAPRLSAFATRLFIGVGRREPARVLLDVFAVE